MLRASLLILAAAFQALNAQTLDINGITLAEKVEGIERQLLDSGTLNFLVSPCSVNFGADPNEGEQTSAQWVRIVFHDAITKGIAGTGLGGLDASIQFESDRTENIGVFVNVTIGQFSQFISPFVSMADLIGVGLSDSLATCDSTNPRIPFRVGRMDASQAGPFGVPGPENSLAFTQAAFNRAGFTNGEMIQAVACGHSLGGVHRTNFPDIVPASAVTSTNTKGRASFDSSPANFNPDIVNEYLSGTTQNPLVVGPPATRSDLRIFNSDGNVTISQMSSATAFRATCHTIFAKMMNTVPNGAVLSDPIGPRPWIVKKGRIDISSTGSLTYSGAFTASGSGTRPNTASYTYKTSGGSVIGGTKTSGPKVEQPEFFNTKLGLGVLANYDFSDPLPSNAASLTVGTFVRELNQNIFISTSRSFRNEIFGTGGITIARKLIIRIAVKTTLATTGTVIKARVWNNIPQANSVGPKVVFAEYTATLKETIGSYKIYHTLVEINQIGGGPTVAQPKIYASGGSLLSAGYKDDATFDWATCDNSVPFNC